MMSKVLLALMFFSGALAVFAYIKQGGVVVMVSAVLFLLLFALFVLSKIFVWMGVDRKTVAVGGAVVVGVLALVGGVLYFQIKGKSDEQLVERFRAYHRCLNVDSRISNKY